VNKATVPILARLHGLQTMAHLAPGGARVLAGMSDANPLAALLREINETVLARALMFESSGGSSLTLDVAGRRILRLTAASGLQGAEICLAAPTLEDEQKDDLIKLLQAVAAPRHELRVVSGPMEREIDGVSVGLPVALLADLCLIELNQLADADPEPEPPPVRRAAPEPEPEPAKPDLAAPITLPDEAPPKSAPEPEGGAFLGRLARDTGPALMAWLISGGADDGATHGPEEMVSHLQDFLADEAEAIGRQLDLVSMVPAGPVCMVLGATLVDGHSILCARAGEGILLGVIEGDGTQTVLRAWNSAQA
jgi:hypothetical protein